MDAINDASAYDKMPGIGPHPKGIHQWWARLPLPCARVMLFASLVDDPSSNPEFAGKSEEAIKAERKRLFGIIRDLCQKKIHEHPEAFERAYREIKHNTGGRLPILVDPFCGGGSIPLEGQRLGLTVQGSDLNPLAVLITKSCIELIPRFIDMPPVNPEAQKQKPLETGGWIGSKGLAEDLKYYGEWIRREADKRIGHLYPNLKLNRDSGGGESKVIAWIWTRAMTCPNPLCRATMPLMRSFALKTKDGERVWVEPALDKSTRRITFTVKSGECNPERWRKIEAGAAAVRESGKKIKATFKCVACGHEPIKGGIIDSIANSGRLDILPVAIVYESKKGRGYQSFGAEHLDPAFIGSERMKLKPDIQELIPTQPARGTFAGNAQGRIYGFKTFGDYFTTRQLVAICTFSGLIPEAREQVLRGAIARGLKNDGVPLDKGGSGATAYADVVATFLAFAVDRMADFSNSLCGWTAGNQKVMHLFGRQAIPMIWDYSEANVMGNTVGSWSTCHEYVADCIIRVPITKTGKGTAIQLDAANAAWGHESILLSTDPPYYDNIGYSDLSDFFYVWLRHSIGSLYPDLFSTMLTPKEPELVATPYRFEGDVQKARKHFENGFKKTFSSLKEKLDPRFPITVYYAFKQSEESEGDSDDEDDAPVTLTTAWETLLESLIQTGFQITSTWPVRASQKWRMVSMGTNALASYIVLACRARTPDAPLARRSDFLSDMKKELPDALKKLQQTSIAPVDLAQASIGPGIAIYSKYSRVVEPDGTTMSVRTALSLINQELRSLVKHGIGDMDSETQFMIEWFEQYGMQPAEFGRAETLSKAKNTSVEGLSRAGILVSRGGKVSIKVREEYPDDWDPVTDRRLTLWECTQHLIRRLQLGEDEAAKLVTRLGGKSEDAKNLAYHLFNICESKGMIDEARAYNELVTSWPEIQRKAAGITGAGPQKILDVGAERRGKK